MGSRCQIAENGILENVGGRLKVGYAAKNKMGELTRSSSFLSLSGAEDRDGKEKSTTAERTSGLTVPGKADAVYSEKAVLSELNVLGTHRRIP